MKAAEAAVGTDIVVFEVSCCSEVDVEGIKSVV